ncbi:MatE efflux family protein [Microlunatus phosphovorus NM-1]|uniref:Multidrug export protein MepA n=1 Tax=Microlunatus phosphovorus (strain ATCC 700054 / DSM 10555 / JCM 9379 / NBRC 101784 / NCIMB 13414 / VKM Ac-1990 / NM-1) TaxID=1032480 RepID=F5XR58_MICPN|nr:MATE family efflux transporter [Microlunatus phosphovorus]BAK37080.1 MatE efflux family protein [Microlunatus phosphovorus NM-1]
MVSVSDRNDSAENLGTRPIGRLLWWTCSQTTLSVGVYGIYALTNAWFVARGVGETALAAVNLVAPLLLLLGAVSTTVGVGGASLVSRSLGARRPDLAARAAGNSFAIFWATAVTVTVVGLAFLDPLLRLVGATDETLPYARPYAMVIIAGAIFSTGFSALVRAEGRLLFSTMLWVVPVLVQIILDPLLIFGLDLGVVGAGLGTVGGQAVSAGMAVWFFFVQRRRPYRIRLKELLPHGPTVRSVLSVGAPSFLAGFGATLLVVLVNTTLAAAGAAVIAAYAVCARVQTFVSMPQIGITQGAQPIISFNAGRQHPERVHRTRTLALRATAVYGAVGAGVIALAARPIVGLFLTDPETVEVAITGLRIIAVGFVFAGVPPLISAYFQALGSPAPSYLISVGTLLLLKVPLVLLLGHVDPLGIWIALPAGEVLAAVAAVIVLRSRTSALVRGRA